jgi:hypothetical protein
MKFVITTTIERTLSELNSYRRDEEVHIEPLLFILDSRNFHWVELRMKDATTRIEAVREHPEPDAKYWWERPHAFRVIYDGRKRQHSEQLIGHHTELCVTPNYRKASKPGLAWF